MKIVAFAGSNNSQSINRKLVQYALTHVSANNEVYSLDLNDYEMPIYSNDREQSGYPEPARRFRDQMENCDCIIVSLAENNKSYTAAFKNIIDWCSRIDRNVFKDKPMFLMSTSAEAHGGSHVMSQALELLPECHAQVIESFSLPSFGENFDEEKGITDPTIKADFERKITIFKEKLLPKL